MQNQRWSRAFMKVALFRLPAKIGFIDYFMKV